MRLVLCDRCQRHVRRGDSICPFCGAPRPASRAGLGAAVILGTGLSVGCGTGSDLGNQGPTALDGSADSSAGDAGQRDGRVTDARDEQPAVAYGPAPAYGLPPPDRDAGIVTLYAAVPAPVPKID